MPKQAPAASAPPAKATQQAAASTNAKPEPQSPADEAARKTAQKQIEDGYRLLRAGFVKKSREKFELAMQGNPGEASLGQGRSMDPSYLKTVAFPDVIPDAEQARRMYRRSILLGNAEAKRDLERLEKALAAAAPVTEPSASGSSGGIVPPANAEPAPRTE